MTIKQTIRLLEAHNKWRKGADIPMIDPKKLSQAIEIAVKELKLIAKSKENYCPECGRKIIKIKHP